MKYAVNYTNKINSVQYKNRKEKSLQPLHVRKKSIEFSHKINGILTNPLNIESALLRCRYTTIVTWLILWFKFF